MKRLQQSELHASEFVAGVPILLSKVALYRPRILCFVGLGIANTVAVYICVSFLYFSALSTSHKSKLMRIVVEGNEWQTDQVRRCGSTDLQDDIWWRFRYWYFFHILSLVLSSQKLQECRRHCSMRCPAPRRGSLTSRHVDSSGPWTIISKLTMTHVYRDLKR